MGRPPNSGVPVFRFTQSEVAEMEACLQETNNAIPSRDFIGALAEKFSASAERAGQTGIQSKQVLNWFQNRRYAQRARMSKSPGKLSVLPKPENSTPHRNVVNTLVAASGINSSDSNHLEFESKSARDGAWYDVASFLSHRMFETGDPEVQIRFTGFENGENEWINICKCVRPRSLPCEPSECVAVLPGDLVLCFQEGKDQALYFDAHVLDAQRRRHDVRGCRCRFLVSYDHDQTEEIVPLRKICRRPETDYRLQILQTSKQLGLVDERTAIKDPPYVGMSKDLSMTVQNPGKLHKLVDDNMEEVVTLMPSFIKPVAVEAVAPAAVESNATVGDAAINSSSGGKLLE